jgi:hypothetical protein
MADPRATGCVSRPDGGQGRSVALHCMNSRRSVTALLLLMAVILSSGRVDGYETWTGRRWFVRIPGHTCYFWGYLKKPQQRWSAARLVILDERAGILSPDKMAAPGTVPVMGADHNFEYSIQGAFTGRYAYDPNSDLVLPVFAARKFTIVNRNPGPLPGVGDPRNNTVVPSREAGGQTRYRIRR